MLEPKDPRLARLLPTSPSFESLSGGHAFLEGPAWDAASRHLVFSDIPTSTQYVWDADHGARPFRLHSNKANGNALDIEGRLLTCEHATSRVVRHEVDGRVRIVADRYDGKALNSPNDIVVRSDGLVYFTDPDFGRRPTRFGVERPRELEFQAVFRLEPGSGSLEAVAREFGQPNGLCFSNDERVLFVNDSPRAQIVAFSVLPDGRLRDGRLWAVLDGDGPGVADGMKVDAEGNLWCCGPGGIHVFGPNGQPWGRIRTPEQAANLCWGGHDGRDLYVCATASLYRLRTRVRGGP